jgi:hypothetical protein
MSLFQWLFHGRSARTLALSFYKRGLTRTKNHDRPGAMEDFTAAIESPGAPDDLRAMALYNRALLLAANNAPEAIVDLDAILAMAAPLREIKLAARRRLDRMHHQHSPGGGSLANLRQSTGSVSSAGS